VILYYYLQIKNNEIKMDIKIQQTKNNSEEIKDVDYKLEVISGPMDGLIYYLKNDIITIGRDETNDFQLSLDLTIGRKHAKIIKENGEYWIEDQNSTNGTYINNQKIKSKEKLTEDIIFMIGLTEIQFIKTI